MRGLIRRLSSPNGPDLRSFAISRVTRRERYLLLVRSGDELLDWREAVTYFAGAYQYVAGGGDHGWSDFADEVPSVLRFATGAAPCVP